MRRLLVIGIGAGDPDYITVQAIKAIQQTDVFFVVDKGAEKAGLVSLRHELLLRYGPAGGYRVVEIEEPARDRTAEAYRSAVDAWRHERAVRYEGAMAAHLADGQCGSILVWGDPSLYDSTLAIVEDVQARGALQFDVTIVPGISSVQALAARHGVTLNRVGEAIQLTTGRRLRAGLPAEAENVVVMLDGGCAFQTLAESHPDLEIVWGAYVGTPDEILVRGPLREVAATIERVRAEARAAQGWIMDTYLLRRSGE
ncbi:MAG: precorrin-6A synthase (deacetylating) [Chloroflexi bacterium]|nr:precorrin-6A synthase (deacetylating) [Chloroflexota bacterium]